MLTLVDKESDHEIILLPCLQPVQSVEEWSSVVFAMRHLLWVHIRTPKRAGKLMSFRSTLL